MNILVLNSGSSSIKYTLFKMPSAQVVAKGLVQRIGEAKGEIEQLFGNDRITLEHPVADHGSGLKTIIQLLQDGPMADISEIEAVGHRVVHGGEAFIKTALIDDRVVEAIEDHVELAPLHNPPNLLGIRVAREVLPDVPQVAVFDTAFHQSMPAHSFTYALPLELYRDAKIRRYGFHGTSHHYVALRCAKLLQRPLEQLNLITCHLGNGSSLAAIKNGKSVDTTMGLTPLEGLVMGTRCGDLDPAIVFHLAKVKNMELEDIDQLLNKKSGLLGISGSSNDMRELEQLSKRGDERAQLAVDIFCYRIKKYIGAYSAVLGRVDALVFTAGIGEHSAEVRERSCSQLSNIGIAIDQSKNSKVVGEADITARGMDTRVLVVPTNEEKRIAVETYELARGDRQ